VPILEQSQPPPQPPLSPPSPSQAPPQASPQPQSLLPSPSILFFFEAIKILTGILYNYENREKKSAIYFFDEFHTVMEGKDVRLKVFFNELYLSSNPSSKNESS